MLFLPFISAHVLWFGLLIQPSEVTMNLIWVISIPVLPACWSWFQYTYLLFLQWARGRLRALGKANLPISEYEIVNRNDTTTAKSLQSCPTLCDPIDGSPPGSPIPGILQARTLEWVAISFCNAWKWKVKSESEVAQSCPTLRDRMDCSLPGSSVHGIFQARLLEWGAK